MKTFWSSTHLSHRPKQELIDGHVAPHVEVPERAELVLGSVRQASLGDVMEVGIDESDVRAAVERVHDPNFVEFLSTAWNEWRKEGRDWDALPVVWRVDALSGPVPASPAVIDGKLSRWSFDAGTPICSGTWSAALGAAACALAAAEAVLAGERASFALCRPPGHHAARAAYGGYCYLNNAAIAAERLREGCAHRIAVLDLDYHHGNGTQAIFWDRPDVLTVSIHADPRQEYPYFLGYAEETGGDSAPHTNLNLPLPWGTGWNVWLRALDQAIARVTEFAADAVVLPLGVDTYESDPISRFRLQTPHYRRVGARVRDVGLPTVVVLEGGYATAAIGANVVGVLTGLADGP